MVICYQHRWNTSLHGVCICTERDWVQVAVLPANVTEYQLGASDGIIYSDFRISAFNQYGSSETVVFNG